MNDKRIRVEMLDDPKPGPGGHWFSYQASDPEYPDKIGYGQTAREAIQNLKGKNNEQK